MAVVLRRAVLLAVVALALAGCGRHVPQPPAGSWLTWDSRGRGMVHGLLEDVPIAQPRTGQPSPPLSVHTHETTAGITVEHVVAVLSAGRTKSPARPYLDAATATVSFLTDGSSLVAESIEASPAPQTGAGSALADIVDRVSRLGPGIVAPEGELRRQRAAAAGMLRAQPDTWLIVDPSGMAVVRGRVKLSRVFPPGTSGTVWWGLDIEHASDVVDVPTLDVATVLLDRRSVGIVGSRAAANLLDAARGGRHAADRLFEPGILGSKIRAPVFICERAGGVLLVRQIVSAEALASGR